VDTEGSEDLDSNVVRSPSGGVGERVNNQVPVVRHHRRGAGVPGVFRV